MRTTGDRVLLVATPFAAILAVAFGLAVGSHGAVRAAVVIGAPRTGVGAAWAWQVAAFEEDRGVRTPLAHAPVDLVVRAAGSETRGSAVTNADGVAEVRFDAAADPTDVEAWVGGARLAEGAVTLPATDAPASPTAESAPWMPFARRTGAVVLDVALLGGRAPPGFDAIVCVRASDALTHAPVPGVAIDVVDDPSVAASAGGRTDSAGWAVLHVTPAGLATSLEVQARRPGAGAVPPAGDWVGGLRAAPGGAALATRPRGSPEEPIALDVVTPTVRRTAYVEIDDAHGRAWGAALDLEAASDGTGHARAVAPKLPPGLYWAFAASDPGAAATLAPGVTVRPFFVAPSDEAALALRGRADGCAVRRDVREAANALWPCLALAPPTPSPRQLLLDGLARQRAHHAARRRRGLGIALGAMAIAAALEAALVVRSARGQRASLVVGTLVALLGFALLASFLAWVA